MKQSRVNALHNQVNIKQPVGVQQLSHSEMLLHVMHKNIENSVN